MKRYNEDDLRDEEISRRKRRSFNCSDRMCGADDCQTCYPTYSRTQYTSKQSKDDEN